MTDPAIRAALEAAVEGYDAARLASFGASKHGGRASMSDRNKQTILPMIAAAIAAFLRGLPATRTPTHEECQRARTTTIRPYINYTSTHLAAAVEAAAKETSHD